LAGAQVSVERAEAVREALLSAGVIGFLQLSEVGDPGHLGRIGVPVAHECAASARTCRAVMSRVSYLGAQTANERSRGLPLTRQVRRLLCADKGMLTCNPSIVVASVKLLERLATLNGQVLTGP
jgi:hypothetical protein